MGNKLLRPSEVEPLSGFNDDQKSWLKEKFQDLCDENKLLSVDKIAQSYKTTHDVANKILNYIDFEGLGQVDFYEFICAAASLHQNDGEDGEDHETQEFLYELFVSGDKMDQDSFEGLFKTIFNYLKYLEKITDEYKPEIGQKKFVQYDYNKNGGIQFDEFQKMLKNDYHCRLWMEALGFAEERPQDPPQRPLNDENDGFLLEEEAGDQAGSTPSWIKTAQYMAPQNFQKPASLDNPPNNNLEINYVYGYRCYDTRDNLRYNSNGEVVYHTGGCGIVLNKHKNTMRVTTVHNDDVTCLDLNINKNLVATGEMGRRPSLVVWDANTLETKAIFKNKLEKSIATVAISKSGKYVAATSMNDNHEIAVYDINKDKLVAYGRGPRSVVYSIKFNSAEDEVVCACSKEVVFAKFLDGKISCKKGVFGKAPLKPNLCVATLGDAIITSMNNGVLAFWKGNYCSRIYKEHNKAVGALCERTDGGIISGDILGNIILWSANMSKQKQISLSKLLSPTISNNPRIISLYENHNNILVGTRGGEIVEIAKNSASILMQGHYDGQLWGLSVSNNRRQFFTGGQDRLLIKWDIEKRKMLLKKKLDYPINSMDMNRSGVIAVGHRNGIVSFYDSNRLQYLKRLQTFKNADKDMISVVKFSPAGNIIAVGYCPPISKVYLYDFDSLKKIGQCKGSPSRILSIDYARDGSSIMINNTSYEILFYSTSNGSQLTSASSFKGQTWSTITSRFSWATQGIWPPCSDGTDINSVDRSNSKNYLVTGDDFSKVKLFKYPVCEKKQIYSAYKGHSSHVTGVKWTFDDKNIISTGGLEKSVIQWTTNEEQEIIYDYEEQQEEKQQEKVEQGQYDEEEQPQEKQQDMGFGLQVDEGDQALAVKPFLGQVKASTPHEYKTMKRANVQPEQDLQIKHVWGIRNQYIKDRVRNQLRYSDNCKSCYYITAALGVEHDLKSQKQTFYQGHQEDLISFAISKDKKYCATGQMAQINQKKPRAKIVDVHVWDAQTKQKKAKLSGFHQRAVVLVEFSPSGKRLLTVGEDDKNSLAVYDWQIGRIAWSSPVCGAKVTGGAWKNEKQYMTVGLKHVKLWDGQRGKMCKIPGKWDPMVSVVYWNGKFVSGGYSGSLYLWSGTTGIVSKGHEGRVDCLSVDSQQNLYSGCSHGQVIRWKYSGGKLVQDQKLFNMSEIDTFSPGVLSLDFSPENYLVCTNSSSIYEIPKNSSASNGRIIMQSHYENELWAESWSPDSQRFVTGGDDKTVRMYDATTYQMLHSCTFKERIRGIDWQQSKGELIVVGDNKGKIYLLDTDLKIIDEAVTKFSRMKPRKQSKWIEDIKFSPNGEYVAFGAHGGVSHLQIHQVKDSKFQGDKKVIKSLITSALLTVDWSQDGENLAIVSQAYELQFTNLDSRVNASAMRDVKWATWSGKFGASVQQIHQDVDYSNINAVCQSPSRSLIATGGDDQKIRLFNYPVIIPKQKNKAYVGHSSHVTRVRFSKNEQYLLSEGGNDRTIILWDVRGAEQMVEQQEIKQKEEGEEQVNDYEGLEDAEVIMVPRVKEQKQVQKTQAQEDEFGLEEDEGDQFMAVKPWLGAIKQPTVPYYKGSGKAPNADLILEYAHGYRVKDCRNNLKYVSGNQITYHTAGLGIIMDISQNPKHQTFFNKHNDDIISMAWSQDKSAMFTGEMGAKPTIYQWNSDGSMIQSYKGVKKGVSAIGVNSEYMVAAGLDDNHYVYLFSVSSGKLIGSEKGGRDVIIDLKWIDEDNFVSIGVKHYKYWTMNGKQIKGKTGSFGKNCNILCCVSVKDSKAYVGASDGSLQIWSGNSCSKNVKVHSRAIHAISLTSNMILTGSSDETIKIISFDGLEVVNTIECAKLFSNSVNKAIRAIDVWQNKVLVGTLGSQIYQINSNQEIDSATSDAEYKLIGNYMNGHYAPNYVTNEVWGLAIYDDRYYVTCSDDATIRLWDMKKKEQVESVSLNFDSNLKAKKLDPKAKFLPDNMKGRCIAVSPNKDLVIGCKDGTIKIIDSHMKCSYSKALSKKQISHIKFSPDGSILAIGAHDGRIFVFDWNEGRIKLKNKRIKHNSYIKHFDFSRDGNILHSTCGAYELLFWDVNTGKQITSGASSTRDEEWATWNVTLGWPVQGIFQQYMDGTDINAVDRTKQTYDRDMKLLASGDDRGKVRLLEYPCLVKNSSSVVGRGHSSHVTNVLFNNSDEYLFSAGGQDQTILQWKIET